MVKSEKANGGTTREQAYSRKNEKFNKKAARYIHELASEKGKDNLTVATFCQ